MTPEYNTFSFGITPCAGGAPEKPLGLVGDTGARGRSIRKASLLVWALLGYAPQRLCPGVYSSLCEEWYQLSGIPIQNLALRDNFPLNMSCRKGDFFTCMSIVWF